MSEQRDYFGEILTLHGSGNIEALAKLALELVAANSVLKATSAQRRSNDSSDGRSNRSGYVYYARDGGELKIGHSRNPWSRVNEMRTARPTIVLLAVEAGDRALERERHEQFAHCRIARGREWFRFTAEIEAHLRATCPDYGNDDRSDGSDGSDDRSSVDAKAATHSPLPIPSSSFPGPHLTTPLTPLPSAPPPPARAREAEPDRPHSELEARLAQQLLSDTDRNALTALIARVPTPTTWLSEMQASLDGMAGHVLVTPEQLGQALRDYCGNGAMTSPGLKHFRIYLRKASAPEPAHAPSDDFDTAVTKHASRGDRRALEAEAGEMLATIRSLIRTHDLHGQGRKEYLPKSEVEKLGPRALRAYESVGGADRVLSAAGDDISFLIRDFTNAYVHATATPPLVGGAA